MTTPYSADMSVNDLRTAGFVVVIWTPEEIGNADESTLEDLAIERGNIYLETMNEGDDDA